MSGTITRKGYRRIRVAGKHVMEHDHVWIQHHGPIPPGHDVHHRNENKLDNRLSNLVLLTKTEHKRIHSGCELRAGVWWKPCRDCRRMLPLDAEHFYLTREGWPQYGKCRACRIRQVVERKQRLRSERLTA